MALRLSRKWFKLAEPSNLSKEVRVTAFEEQEAFNPFTGFLIPEDDRVKNIKKVLSAVIEDLA